MLLMKSSLEYTRHVKKKKEFPVYRRGDRVFWVGDYLQERIYLRKRKRYFWEHLNNYLEHRE